MTEISTCFHCKPRHCLLLDKTSVGKLQKWGDDKNLSHNPVEKSRRASVKILAYRSMETYFSWDLKTEWKIFELRVSKPETHRLFWWLFHTYCVLQLSASTHCHLQEDKAQADGPLSVFAIKYLWPKSFCFCTPPKLPSLCMFWGRLRNRSQAVSHSWAI